MKKGQLPDDLSVLVPAEQMTNAYTGREYLWVLGYLCRWTKKSEWFCRSPVVNANLHMPRSFIFRKRDLRYLAELLMALYWKDESKIAAATEQGVFEVTVPALLVPAKQGDLCISPRLLRDVLAGVCPINVPFGFGLKPRGVSAAHTGKRANAEQQAITEKLCQFYSEIDPGLVDEDCEAEYLALCQEVLKHAQFHGYPGFRWAGPANGILIHPQYLTTEEMNRGRRILLGITEPEEAPQASGASDPPAAPAPAPAPPTVQEVCRRALMDQVTETMEVVQAKGAHPYYHRVLRYQDRTIYQGTAYTPKGPWVAYWQDVFLLASLGLDPTR